MNFCYKTEDDLDLVEILKNCPKDTKLYTPLYGYVTLLEVRSSDSKYPIIIENSNKVCLGFDKRGRIHDNPDCSCCLFPRCWRTIPVHAPEPH